FCIEGASGQAPNRRRQQDRSVLKPPDCPRLIGFQQFSERRDRYHAAIVDQPDTSLGVIAFSAASELSIFRFHAAVWLDRERQQRAINSISPVAEDLVWLQWIRSEELLRKIFTLAFDQFIRD